VTTKETAWLKGSKRSGADRQERLTAERELDDFDRSCGPLGESLGSGVHAVDSGNRKDLGVYAAASAAWSTYQRWE